MHLEPPARHFPITRDVYEVAPGLKPLGTDLGNGVMDSRVFQLDTEFPKFQQNKIACRAEQLGKYFLRHNLSIDVECAVIDWLIERLITEYPQIFSKETDCLICQHTGDEIRLDSASMFDELANQISEDLCVICQNDSGDWLAAAHVCSPGHWSPGEKIGRPFTEIHQPIPGIDPINRHADQFVQMMIHRGPFVRFAWGFGTDDRLNHHPQPPAGVDPARWHGREFDPENPAFFLRVERQVMWGLPQVRSAVFVIRVSHLRGDQIRSKPAECQQLIFALNSMTPQARRYKGLANSVDAITAWLSQR